tara:strand:- start:76 stop:705 length:630 start_codon:yes stop_codon:yes gene_type:complete
MKKPKAKKISTDATRVEKPAMQFKYMAGNKAISPKFEGNVKGADHLDGMARGGYYSPDYVKQRKLNAGVIMVSEKNPAFKSPAKNINPQVDPTTGQMLQPQPITNRAGVPSRSINDLQGINTIQDPGMQSAQQADSFQKFNNIAQYNPPPAMKHGSPAKSYTKPAMIIDKSAGGLAEAGKAVQGSVESKISQDSASEDEELINFLMNQQ